MIKLNAIIVSETMSNLKEEFRLPENVHVRSVEHTRKEYQCEQCFNMIPIGSSTINYTEEIPSKYGRNFENKRFCSNRCFSHFLIEKGKIKSGSI